MSRSSDLWVEVTVPAKRFADDDDSLSAAARDLARKLGLAETYDLAPRWKDDQRDLIVLTVPRWAVRS